MGEVLLRSSHSWKSAAFALALLPFAAFVLSPVWAEQRAPDITVLAFFADPNQILLENPDGGARLVADVRDLALADPATLPEILSLLPKVSKAQKAAIGAGLARAASASARSNPRYAKEIQQAVVETKDADLMQAYDAAATEEFSGLTGNKNGLGSVSDTGAPAGSGAAETTIPLGVPSVFVPGNIASTTTNVPLTTASVPVPGGVTAALPGPLTAVAVPNIPVPSAPESSVTVASVPGPGVTVPNVTPNAIVPNVTPNVTVTGATVPRVAFAFPPGFTQPPTPLSESVSPQ